MLTEVGVRRSMNDNFNRSKREDAKIQEVKERMEKIQEEKAGEAFQKLLRKLSRINHQKNPKVIKTEGDQESSYSYQYESETLSPLSKPR